MKRERLQHGHRIFLLNSGAPQASGKAAAGAHTRVGRTSNENKLGELNRMRRLPSPRAEGRQLAKMLVGWMMAWNAVSNRWMTIRNAVRSLAGEGTGADLLLYATLDTACSNNEGEECPWIGERLPVGMTAMARCAMGMSSAMARKILGHAAVNAAPQAIERGYRSKVRYGGLGSGGMPTNGGPNLKKSMRSRRRLSLYVDRGYRRFCDHR